jgi:hypothetical protein
MPSDPPKRRYSLTRENIQMIDALIQQGGVGLILHLLSHTCSKLAEKWATKGDLGDLEMADAWDRFAQRLDRLANDAPAPSKMQPAPAAARAQRSR